MVLLAGYLRLVHLIGSCSIVLRRRTIRNIHVVSFDFGVEGMVGSHMQAPVRIGNARARDAMQ